MASFDAIRPLPTGDSSSGLASIQPKLIPLQEPACSPRAGRHAGVDEENFIGEFRTSDLQTSFLRGSGRRLFPLPGCAGPPLFLFFPPPCHEPAMPENEGSDRCCLFAVHGA